MALHRHWVDLGREPKNAPDPAYPNGKPLDATGGKAPSCSIDLPHPTPRCGYWLVVCDVCGLTAAATTAGRPDDPSSLKVLCKRQ